MRPGVRGSTVAALAVFSALIALVALTGGVAANGGVLAGSTAVQAGDTVDVTGRAVDGASGQAIDTERVVPVDRSGDMALDAFDRTNATGAFAESTVTRNLTVTSDRTVTVADEGTSTLVVDPDDPAAYDTIGAAVNDAPAGGTVRVRPGTYEGPVRIRKPLTLLGRPGDSAPGPAGSAPIVTGAGRNVSGLVIGDNVSNVTIAGFEIRNYSFHDGHGGRGITAQGTGHANVLVRDNHVHDIGWTAIVEDTPGTTVRNWTVTRNVVGDFATFGIRLANVEGATVTDNTVTGTGGWAPWNGRTTSDIGILIEAKQRAGTSLTVSSVRVADNDVGGELRAGISVNAWNTLTTGSTRLNGVAVRNNTVTGENVRFGIGMGSMGHDAAVRDGQITNNTVARTETGIGIWTLRNASAAAVRVKSNAVRNGSSGLSVLRTATAGTVRTTDNQFVDNRIGVVIAANGSARNTIVSENAIANNTRYGVANNGTGTLNATYNWWGASDGPGGAFDGSGDAVLGNATVRPFYVDAERTRLSPATLPPVIGDRRPLDPDGDGLYEDVNGDGDLTPGDATVLFNAVFDRNPAVADNVAAFDFNGDGSVTPGDATVLFDEAF